MALAYEHCECSFPSSKDWMESRLFCPRPVRRSIANSESIFLVTKIFYVRTPHAGTPTCRHAIPRRERETHIKTYPLSIGDPSSCPPPGFAIATGQPGPRGPQCHGRRTGAIRESVQFVPHCLSWLGVVLFFFHHRFTFSGDVD